MQTVEAFITDLWHRGVQIELEGDGVSVYPRSRLTDTDRQAIRALKGELLVLLKDPYERDRVIARYCEAHRIDLSTFLDERPDLIRGDCGEGTAPSTTPTQESAARTPAHSIVAICQRHGVALRIDPETGGLVVGRAAAGGAAPTQPWPSLLLAIEAHLNTVIALVKAGWALSQPYVNGEYVH